MLQSHHASLSVGLRYFKEFCVNYTRFFSKQTLYISMLNVHESKSFVREFVRVAGDVFNGDFVLSFFP